MTPLERYIHMAPVEAPYLMDLQAGYNRAPTGELLIERRALWQKLSETDAVTKRGAGYGYHPDQARLWLIEEELYRRSGTDVQVRPNVRRYTSTDNLGPTQTAPPLIRPPIMTHGRIPSEHLNRTHLAPVDEELLAHAVEQAQQVIVARGAVVGAALGAGFALFTKRPVIITAGVGAVLSSALAWGSVRWRKLIGVADLAQPGQTDNEA